MNDMRGPKIGIRAAAEMLAGLDPESRSRLFKNMLKQDPALAKKILREMFSFDDLATLDSSSIQALLREIPSHLLVVALRGVSDAIKNVLFKNMTARAAQVLKDDIQSIGPQKKSDVEAAQDQILEIARRLETEGKLLLKKGNA